MCACVCVYVCVCVCVCVCVRAHIINTVILWPALNFENWFRGCVHECIEFAAFENSFCVFQGERGRECVGQQEGLEGAGEMFMYGRERWCTR